MSGLRTGCIVIGGVAAAIGAGVLVFLAFETHEGPVPFRIDVALVEPDGRSFRGFVGAKLALFTPDVLEGRRVE